MEQLLVREAITELVAQAKAAGFRQMIAVIGGGEPASVARHAALGFKKVGRLTAVGWKHGRWLDSVYMPRPLGDGVMTYPKED